MHSFFASNPIIGGAIVLRRTVTRATIHALPAIWLPFAILAFTGMGILLAQSHVGATGDSHLAGPGETFTQEVESSQEEAGQEEAGQQDGEQAAANALLIQQRDAIKERTTWNNPACIADNQQCIDCHYQETKAWLASKHATRAFDLLRTSESSLEYAKNLGIRPNDITRTSLCVNCHGTPQVKLNGKLDVITAVSCEACHGSSLGEDGWLNIHAVYGHSHTLREHETPEHYAYRQQRCDEAGQLRSDNLYEMTKRCFDCHVIGDEALAIAGHNHGDGFEMIEKTFGEIRHNFVLDESVNAHVATLWHDPSRHGNTRTVEGRLRVIFVLGQMVDLEVSLRGLARATEENDFSDEMIGRIEGVYELLAEDILEEIVAIDEEEAEEGADEPRERPELEEIEAVVKIIEPLWEKLDDDGFNKDETAEYVAAADSISALARQFGRRDGSNLEVLDPLELLPEDFFESAYDPNPPQEADEEPEDG